MKLLHIILGSLIISIVGLSFALADNNPTPAGSHSLLFIQNQGQFDKPIRYQVFGTSQTMWLMDDGLWFTLSNDEGSTSVKLTVDQPGELTPHTPLPTHINYMGGTHNLTTVPVWAGVRYSASDLVVSSENGRLTLSGQDIRLTLQGGTILSNEGDLLYLDTAIGQQTLRLPTSADSWQLTDRNTTLAIPGRDTSRPTTANEPYSPIGYSTFIGGRFAEHGRAIDVDDNGNAYVSGLTLSNNFPITLSLGLRMESQHGVDVYVTKASVDGTTLDYMTFVNPVSGTDEDHGFDLTIDDDANVYAVGRTDSPDFCPAGVPGFDTTYNTNSDGFLFKLDPTGAFVYCTYIGGSEIDFANSVTVGDNGTVYVGGGTFSTTDFPTTPEAYDTTNNGLRDSFVLAFNSNNTIQLYGTFVGGSNQETVRALEVDAAGNVYATGWTSSNDFDTTPNAFDTTPNGGFEAYVYKLNPAGDTLVYSTYLGGSNEDRAWGLAVDSAGQATVTGQTNSDDFPTTANALFDTLVGGNDVLLTTLNPAGSDLIFSTYLGGDTRDIGEDITLSNNGYFYLTGSTNSTNFPVTPHAFDTVPTNRDIFITRLRADYSLNYSTYLGGSEEDEGFGITFDEQGNIYLTGQTRSPDFPLTPGAFDELHNGDYDIFITKFTILEQFLPILQKP